MNTEVSDDTDTLEREMQETRASLAEKLESLEQKVVGTVENATNAVSQTVDTIKETVHETVASVQDGVKDGMDAVKDAVDIPAHVDRHPWLMVGGSVAVGLVVGTLVMSNSRQSYSPPSTSSSTPFPPAPLPPAPHVPSPPAQPSMWAPEIDKLKGLAIGMLFGTAREMLTSSMPDAVREPIKDVVDSVTRKLGGSPFSSQAFESIMKPTPKANCDSPESASQPLHDDADLGHNPSRRW